MVNLSCPELKDIVTSGAFPLPLELIESANNDGSFTLTDGAVAELMLRLARKHLELVRINEGEWVKNMMAKKATDDLIQAHDELMATLTLDLELKTKEVAKLNNTVHILNASTAPNEAQDREIKRLNELNDKITIDYLAQVAISDKLLVDWNGADSQLALSNSSLAKANSELTELRPLLATAKPTNEELVVVKAEVIALDTKWNRNKVKLAAAIAREAALTKQLNEALKPLQEEIKEFKRLRVQDFKAVRQGQTTIEVLERDRVQLFELLAVSGRARVWENKERGTYLTYYGSPTNWGATVVDGTPVDRSKPLYVFHHPHGISRIVTFGGNKQAMISVSCNNNEEQNLSENDETLPTDEERDSIAEFIDNTDLSQVQEMYEKISDARSARHDVMQEALAVIDSKSNASPKDRLKMLSKVKGTAIPSAATRDKIKRKKANKPKKK